jgi:hydroxymethylbilane synthase
VAQDLRLGTRGSQLALWQANTVAARIVEAGGPPCRIVVIKTSGDRLQDAPLSEIGGKRLFVKEIEDALLRHEIDLAVHSSKDMPAVLPEGLAIAAVLPREDPLDAIVLPEGVRLKPDTAYDSETDRIEAAVGSGPTQANLVSGFNRTWINQLAAAIGESPTFGTGSVRRIAQLTRLFPNARFAPIRGNLDTRLRKLDNGEHDALVLAAAGLRRLGFESRISFRAPASLCVPAPGQGIVAIEIREDDEATRRAVTAINDAAADAALTAERTVVETLGGGCQTPVGALATPTLPDGLELLAVVVSLDGSRALYATSHGPRSEAAAIGARAGARLLADGAAAILAAAASRQSSVDSRQSAAMTDD